MRKNLCAATILASAALPTAAYAEPQIVLQPMQTDGQAVRFDRGQFVIDLPGRSGAVQVRSIPGKRDDVSFEVGILNSGSAPINVDIGDIRVEGTKESVHVLTRGEIEHKAEHHARWAKFWTTLGTSLAAAGQANQRDYYQVTTMTPHGIYSSTVSAPCYSCQAASNETLAAGHARVAQIQATLDQTRAALGERAFQLTTIAPGQAYEGQVSLTRFKHRSGDAVKLVVTVNGEPFAFDFRFVPEGTPAPTYRSLTQAILPAPPLNNSYSTLQVRQQQAMAAPVQPGPPMNNYLLIQNRKALPPPVSRQKNTSSVNSEVDRNWHRYYAALVANGVSKSQAKEMADREFGPIA